MLDAYPEKKNAKIKTRGRKGIPDSMRGYAWQILSQSQNEIKKDKSQYF